ncbi:MAG TPA: dTMP kinase, partial [Trueperaceae bacterium]
QGYGRGLDTSFVQELTRHVTSGLEPDLTVLLDLEPEAGLARVAARGAPDRLERADLAFHRRVREGFRAMAAADPRWLVLDADEPQEALAESIWQALRTKLAR